MFFDCFSDVSPDDLCLGVSCEVADSLAIYNKHHHLY
jgi:hypothetical protein